MLTTARNVVASLMIRPQAPRACPEYLQFQLCTWSANLEWAAKPLLLLGGDSRLLTGSDTGREITEANQRVRNRNPALSQLAVPSSSGYGSMRRSAATNNSSAPRLPSNLIPASPRAPV